ncbi:MAG: response regulator [Oscillochloris sp.]|nr:response regulator [Oscillochloris sp.]
MIIPPHAPPERVLSADIMRMALLESLEPAALRMLYATNRQLIRCQGRADVYDTIVSGAQSVVNGVVALFVPGHHSGVLHLVASVHAPEMMPTEISVPAQWLAMLYERGISLSSEAWISSQNPLVGLSARMGYSGLAIALPLVGATQYYGLLTLAPRITPLTSSQEAALTLLASDAAHTLDQIAQSEGLQHAVDMGGSSRVLTAVNAVTDIGLLYSNLIDQMLGAILTQILTVLNLAGGAILLYNEQSEDLELAAVSAGPGADAYDGEVGALWQPSQLPRSVAEARAAASHGQVLISTINDNTPMAAVLHDLGVFQLINVPLLAGGWLTGVLQVITMPATPISEQHVQILHILARQTAVAIENARLFAQTRNDQERTSAVVDATNDAILMLDERRRTMIINRRARFFFGLSERELQEKDLDQLEVIFNRIFEEASRFQSWLRQLLRSATERAVEEFRIIRPETRLLQCFSAPVMDVNDRYLGRILVFRDITREREVERMKSDFVSNVSHELRTPLTSIQGALQLVLGPARSGRPGMTDGLSQRARDLLTISLNNTERLIRLINDLLDIAKIEQGRIQLRREALTPEDLCRSAAAEMSAFANNRGITIDIDIQPALPKVVADGDRSAQILVNLLSNAIKFSVSGQRVLLSVCQEGSAACFAVRDWGRGIAGEDQSRLFQKFQQIDSSATRDVGGTGLGLAISKALVEEQGGRIWLDSTPGKGSTFSFTLPIVGSADSSADMLAAHPLALLVGLGSVGSEVLTGLGQAGWRVQEVADPALALASAQANPPDMLIVLLPLDPHVAVMMLDGLVAETDINTALVLAIGDLGELQRVGVTLLPVDLSAGQIVEAALAAMATRQPHVLVVDDDPHVRPVLVRLLQRHGLRVTNVADGFTALATIERVRPDVVLLDVKMPGIDGTEVLRRIKQNPATAATRVIILTANDLGDSLQTQVLGLGADGYLEKPITYERLISAVTSAIVPDKGSHGN